MKKLKTAFVTSALAAAALAAAPAQASTVIDFEDQSSGTVAEGTTIGGITFSSGNGSGLRIGSYGQQGSGTYSLGVFGDRDGNYLIGTIAGGATSLMLDFGNDDPCCTNPGELATLQIFSAGVLLDTVTVVLNRDDIMNQTIGYSGAAFDSFTFGYTDTQGGYFTGGGRGLIEIVDNISYTGAVPEPMTWMMLILGFLGIGGLMRRKNAVARPSTLRVTYS